MPYGVSDVVNAAKFLTINADILHVGKITVWAESQVAETVSSALNQTGNSALTAFQHRWSKAAFLISAYRWSLLLSPGSP